MIKIKLFALLSVACFGVFLITSVRGQGNPEEEMKEFKMDCLDCHTCPTPTMQNPCLKPCPSMTWAKNVSKHGVAEAPDSMLLDKLVDQYGPVHFNHKVHAQMSGMNKGCETCHHYSPAGHIPPCSKCHGGEANPSNMGQPSLKGAYHRQCLCCHREWSHDTKCVICHNPIDSKFMQANAKDSTDIMGISHPIITVPDKKVFFTPYKPGEVVTFYHQEHIDLFGLRCVDCHKKENCNFCHDLEKPAALAKTQEQVHAICSNCHANDRCEKCHSGEEKPSFTHIATGWKLSKQHASLSCRACHPTGQKIARLDTSCKSCHAGWNQSNFKHASVTGLELDETHSELDCDNCHDKMQFDSKPNCANCHDDGRNPSSSPPGKFIKLTQR
jgi:hypothetical protein